MLSFKNLHKEIQPQLGILENSETLLTIIIIGSIIRLGYLGKQKEMLVNSVLCPEKNVNSNKDGFCIELLSSLLILYGLFGFYNQSKDILHQSCKVGTATKNQCIDTLLSEIVLSVSLIRLYQLFKTNDQRNPTNTNQIPRALDETI